MTGPRPAWDDERLNAAFATRAARRPGPPDDLPVVVLDRVAIAGGHLRSRRRRLPTFLGVAAAVALAATAGVSQLGQTDRPSASAGTAGVPPSASSNQAAAATFGTPIDVSSALAIRDAGVDDRELLVSGYLSEPLFPLSCPFPPVGREPNPARVDCPGLVVWLMERPEQLTTTTGDSTSRTTTINPPTGPAIHPAFQIVDSRTLGDARPDPTSPWTVTVAGHFDDRRAALCAQTDRAACGDTFVVDRLVVVDGRTQPVSTLLVNTHLDDANQDVVTVNPTSTNEDVDRLVESADPAATILSRQLRTGDRLGEVEPAIAKDPAWTGQRLVWIVATESLVDDRPAPRTFLVVDGTTVVQEISAAGIHTLSGAASSPAPSASGLTGAIDDLLAHPISVAEAIDHRDHHLDDAELAVKGFAWSPMTAIDCLVDNTTPAPFRGCERRYTWLAETAEARPSPISPEPASPAFNLFVEPDTSIGVALGASPTTIIALGHFDDHRATACVPEKIESCRRNFVVDALIDPANATADGLPAKVQGFDGDPRPVATADEVGALAQALTPGRDALVEVAPVRGGSLAGLEPITTKAPELASARVVWVVRLITTDRTGRTSLVTKLIVDGSLSEMRSAIYNPGRVGLTRQALIVD